MDFACLGLSNVLQPLGGNRSMVSFSSRLSQAFCIRPPAIASAALVVKNAQIIWVPVLV